MVIHFNFTDPWYCVQMSTVFIEKILSDFAVVIEVDYDFKQWHYSGSREKHGTARLKECFLSSTDWMMLKPSGWSGPKRGDKVLNSTYTVDLIYNIALLLLVASIIVMTNNG